MESSLAPSPKVDSHPTHSRISVSVRTSVRMARSRDDGPSTAKEKSTDTLLHLAPSRVDTVSSDELDSGNRVTSVWLTHSSSHTHDAKLRATPSRGSVSPSKVPKSDDVTSHFTTSFHGVPDSLIARRPAPLRGASSSTEMLSVAHLANSLSDVSASASKVDVSGSGSKDTILLLMLSHCVSSEALETLDGPANFTFSIGWTSSSVSCTLCGVATSDQEERESVERTALWASASLKNTGHDKHRFCGVSRVEMPLGPMPSRRCFWFTSSVHPVRSLVRGYTGEVQISVLVGNDSSPGDSDADGRLSCDPLSK
mmetsp:Transcript_46774/g.124148  ORF Transcript_46774/g.124148 Transcript_46774/m.124148 type:complete len:312 (-) Transcript_46774:2130-3065(-)